MRAGLALLAAGLAAACSETPVAPTPYDTTLSTKDLMKFVVDPAAVALWGRAGALDTDQGVVDLAPDTEEEWLTAESEAAIVAEAGNLLILPARVRVLKDEAGKPAEYDKGDWTTFALAMTREALAVKTATAARNTQAMFKSGGDLYQACVACHEKYYVPFLKDGEDASPEAPR